MRSFRGSTQCPWTLKEDGKMAEDTVESRDGEVFRASQDSESSGKNTKYNTQPTWGALLEPQTLVPREDCDTKPYRTPSIQSHSSNQGDIDNLLNTIGANIESWTK